jgi:molybdopterin molybdotransferase
LAEDLCSGVDLPHFHRAAMDGYAVKAKDTFGASASLPAYLKLAGVVEMGKEATRPLATGEAMRISTGGMIPPESDAVVMVEYADETDAGLVEVHRGVSPWQNVIQIGDDVKKGDLVFQRGRRSGRTTWARSPVSDFFRTPVYRRALRCCPGDEMSMPTPITPDGP